MRAVWVRARSDLRNHWRALVAMCLLAGLSGAVAVAAAIGASRTDSVSSRVIQKEDPTDIFYVPDYQDTKLRFADIAALPGCYACPSRPRSLGPARWPASVAILQDARRPAS